MNKTARHPGRNVANLATLSAGLIAIFAVVSGCSSTSRLPHRLSHADTGYPWNNVVVTEASHTISRDQLIGTYSYADGFWEWKIGLFADGRFLLVAFTDTLLVEEDGIRHQSSVEAAGTWALGSGSTITFHTTASMKPKSYTIVQIGAQLGLMEPTRRPERHVYVQVSREEDKLVPQP